ncbi:tyrosine-type recombinase/integrase [uncultured Photobacterium sp.]|uniref:tyrosine-type recombinase/integrase n=1 Tax=uncultured Photobacterium sp. TaxID=173973 RepID=UPI00261F105C|nr:tyrosine-type recombinase/integrase [uncultured Photobacterium sp.]
MTKKIKPIKDNEQKKASLLIFNQYMDSIEPWQFLTHNQYAKNTLVAFKNDWNNFLAFCIENKITALPATSDTVHRYVDYMSRKRKLSSLKRYMVTISLVHRCHHLTDPCAHTEIRIEMQKQQREKHDDCRNASAFRDEHLQQLLNRFELSTKFKDIRDMAIWAVTFEAMLKRSELAAITIDSLEIHSNGLINIHVEDKVIALSSVSSKALQRWLVAGMIDDGFIFRRIDRHGNIGEQALDHSSIYRVFRRASDELNLPSSNLFSGQSPRVGAAKDLADSGLSITEIQEQGRWKSPAMPALYAGHTDRHDQEIAKYIKLKPWEK